MLPSLSNFDRQYRTEPRRQVMREVARLRQLDGKEGDLNKLPDAISVQTGAGRLDAVVLSDSNLGTVAQQIIRPDGTRTTSLLDVPHATASDSAPLMSGFEVTEGPSGTVGVRLGHKDQSYPNPAQYDLRLMSEADTANSLVRAKAVLASFEVPTA